MPKSHLQFLDVPILPEGSQLGLTKNPASPHTTCILRGIYLQEVLRQIHDDGQHRLWDK